MRDQENLSGPPQSVQSSRFLKRSGTLQFGKEESDGIAASWRLIRTQQTRVAYQQRYAERKEGETS